MRWLLVPLGVFLLVWLASGDARAAGPDIRSAKLANPSPGVVGVWVMLSPDACAPARVLQAHFEYAGTSYVVERLLPPCPSPPVFVGVQVPEPPPGVPAAASAAYVVELPLGRPEAPATQRYPAEGVLPMLWVQEPTEPWPAIGWNAANVGAVSGLWAFAWWRDPSRVRASLSRGGPGR